MEMTKHVFIGAVNGTWKDETSGKEIPTYTLYCAKEMRDRQGNEYGYGYKPITLRIDKEQFQEFTSLDFGVQFLAEIFCYKNQKGAYSYKLMRYEL